MSFLFKNPKKAEEYHDDQKNTSNKDVEFAKVANVDDYIDVLVGADVEKNMQVNDNTL